MEDQRLEEDRTREKNWKRWGPYLSERMVCNPLPPCSSPSGEPSAKITQETVIAGITFLTTMPALVPIAGEKMACSELLTDVRRSLLALPP